MPAVPLLVAVAVVPLCTIVYALAIRSAAKQRPEDHALCSIFQLQQRIKGCHSQVDVLLLPLSCCEAERVLAADTTFAAAHVVGLDCEWQPEAASQHSPVSLLQLCAGSKCYLAQLLHMDDVPSQLRYLLEKPLVVKVGVGIREDVRRLQKDYNIRVASAVDLVDVIRTTQPTLLAQGASLAALSRSLLELDVDKSLQCSDWGSLHLTEPQLTYAALDAWLSLCLAVQLLPVLSSDQQQQQQQQQQLPAHCESQVDSMQQLSADKQLCSSGDSAGARKLFAELCLLLRPFAVQKVQRSAGLASQRTQQGIDRVKPAQQPLACSSLLQQQTPSGLVCGLPGPKLPARCSSVLYATSSGNKQMQQVHQQQAVIMQLQQQLQCCSSVEQQALLLWQAAWQLVLLQHRQLHQAQQQTELLQLRQQRRAARCRFKQQAQANVAGSAASTEAAEQGHNSDPPQDLESTQQRRQLQLQLQQLERLGLQSYAPRRSIYERLNKLKPARLPTRKCLQYENCRILSPEGVGLATCGLKKVRWYLERDLAELVSEDPAVIRLKFTPKGSGHADDAYYLSEKVNQCVVCGHTGEYLRHSIVPHCYRSHFPAHMKSHLSHDIVLLCPGCHQTANMAAQARMQDLGLQYGAPFEDSGKRFQTDKQLGAVCSAAKALSGRAASKIPPSRVAELQAVILQHFGRENHTWPASLAEQQQLLAAALAVNPKTAAEGWQSHAAVVVAGVAAEGRTLQPCGEHTPHHQQQQQQQQCTAPQPPLQEQQGLQQQAATATSAALMQSASPAADMAVNSRQDAAAAAAAAPTGNSAAAVPASEPAAGAAAAAPAPDRAAAAAAAAAADAPLSWYAHTVATLAGAGALLAAGAAEASGLDEALAGRVQQHQQEEQQQVQGQHQQEDDLTVQPQELTVQQQQQQEVQQEVQQQQQQQCPLVMPGSTQLSCAPVMVYGFQSWLLAMTAAAAATAAVIPRSASCTSLHEHCSSSGSVGSSSRGQQPVQPFGASTGTGSRNGPAAADAATTAGAAVATSSSQAAQQAGADATEAAFGSAGASGMQFSAAAEAALEAFVRGWRSHFLETMQPKFLPPFWSVDSRVKNSAAPTNKQG